MPLDSFDGVRSTPSTRNVRFTSNEEKVLPNEVIEARVHWKSIEDFCSALCTPDHNGREIGFVIDEADDKQQHRLYRANTITGLHTSSKSLEDLLRAHNRVGDEGLSRKDRLQIAVVLASSVLQLDGTSWLKNGWSSVDIFFHHKNGQPSTYSYPYLAWQRCCQPDIAHSIQSLRISSHMVRNETLLNLGLTLVELCFGRTLADMRRSEDEDTDEQTTRLRTAIRLHQRIYDEMGIPYGDVVRRCLFQTFDVRELSLDIEEVQQKILDGVVTPLIEDLNNFNGQLRIR